jgi:8-oxo-dGTP pyrophosphatase MutT (NUDIX family)
MERTDLLPIGAHPGKPSAGGIAAPFGFTKGDIRRLFLKQTQISSLGAPIDRGDHELNPGMLPLVELRAAAVLVGLVDRPEGTTILLTQRTRHLSRHAGQIAFPGGKVDEGDADEIATALRETEEEIGLGREHIEPVGRLDRYVTRTGFTVTPIVALIQSPFALTLDANEVDEAFEVPLAFILDPANQQRDSYEYQGVMRHFYVFAYGERRIWGATAGMLVNLAEIFSG